MFENIGRKIKTLAEIFCFAGIILSVIVGLLFVFNDNGHNHSLRAGLIILILGSFLAYVNSLLIYGFGQLIDNSDEMVMHYRKKEREEKVAKADEILRKRTEKAAKERAERQHKVLQPVADSGTAGNTSVQINCPDRDSLITGTEAAGSEEQTLTSPECSSALPTTVTNQ